MTVEAGCVGWYTGDEDSAALTFPQSPKPQYPWMEHISYSSSVQVAEDGSKKGARMWAQPQRLIEMMWTGLQDADMAILWDFYQTTRGPLTPFKLYDPADDTLIGNFTFVDETMSKEMFDYALHKVSLTVIQTYAYTVPE